MKLATVLAVLFLAGCSTSDPKPQDPPDPYVKVIQNMIKDHAPAYAACLEHNKQVLQPAFTEHTPPSNKESDEGWYRFVSNEKEAVQYLQKFDVSKFPLREAHEEEAYLALNCVDDEQLSFVRCDYEYLAFNFFRGAIYGMEHYRWSSATKELAKKVALGYVRMLANNPNYLNLNLANSIIAKLAEKGFILKSLTTQSNRFKMEIEQAEKDLKNRVLKFVPQEIPCEESKKLYEEEEAKTLEMAQRFQIILNQIR